MQYNFKLIPITLTAGTMFLSTAVFSSNEYPKIYPFVPEKVSNIYSEIEKISEDKDFLKNFNDIISAGLSKGRTKNKPWTSSYWPLSKGTIADPYEDTTIEYYVQPSWIIWNNNYKSFKKRKKNVLAHIDKFSEADLEKLAPSEKYDLLLGDKSFDLTNRLFTYMKKWGSKKEFGFLINPPSIIGANALEIAQAEIDNFGWHRDLEHAFTNSYRLAGSLSVEYANLLVKKGKFESVELAFPEAVILATQEANNYVLEKKNKRLAAWEGICNGWATAAGVIPRPRKTVSFKLPSGKNLKFFPSDIKGLVSLFWVNSMIQDNVQKDSDGKVTRGGTLNVGRRCNLSNAELDEWGRLYDHIADPYSGILESRCAGVHPAKWHLGLVNIIGKQKRSFVVERKVNEAVDNHPMYKYKMKYYNPNNGITYKSMNKNVQIIDEADEFRKFRSPKAHYIVGVETVMTYLNYAKPNRKSTDSEKNDKEVDKKMFYDLELDKSFNIVGGQWRPSLYGSIDAMFDFEVQEEEGNYNQPDFFWAVTRQWKETGLFNNDKELSSWTDKSIAPPRDWLNKAKSYHSFEYKDMYLYGTGKKCGMQNKETGEWRKVSCEMSYNRPQPLINIVNALVERSK